MVRVVEEEGREKVWRGRGQRYFPGNSPISSWHNSKILSSFSIVPDYRHDKTKGIIREISVKIAGTHPHPLSFALVPRSLPSTFPSFKSLNGGALSERR